MPFPVAAAVGLVVPAWLFLPVAVVAAVCAAAPFVWLFLARQGLWLGYRLP